MHENSAIRNQLIEKLGTKLVENDEFNPKNIKSLNRIFVNST